MTTHERVHGKKVTLRRTLCVRVTATPGGGGTPPAESPQLRVTVQISRILPGPVNPYARTYSFSASASERLGAIEQPATLPAGTLDVYTDKRLVCSIQVGGPITGGECPVTYTLAGTHAATVEYVGGSHTARAETAVLVRQLSTSTTLVSRRGSCATVGETERCNYLAWVSTRDANGNIPTEGYSRLLFRIAPYLEGFLPNFDPEQVGTPGVEFTEPVRLALERTHTAAGWTCLVDANGHTQWFGGEWPANGSAVRVYPVECGTSVWVSAGYATGPAGAWGSSSSGEEELLLRF